MSLDMFDSLKQSDYATAMRVWTLVKPFEDLRARRNSANNVPVVKEALAQLGLCERYVRPPISELPESERAEVRSILASWDVERAPLSMAMS
jgi:4-hydroxy-tetrahydrodipicolinate synthase